MQLSFNYEVLELQDFRLDLAARRFSFRGIPIFLRNKEFSLMEFFFNNCGRVVSRLQLLEEVWDRNMCENTNTVDVHVSSLRKKFLYYCGFDPIKTVYCIGYRFEP